jgi:hypothetical protein
MVRGQTELFEIVGARHLVRRLADLLDRRHDQADEKDNDGDDN